MWQALKDVSLPQVHAALAIGLPPSTLASYLAGHRPMPDDVRRRLETVIREAKAGQEAGSHVG